MICPGCAAEMTTLTLEGHLGRTVAVDVCDGCQAFWFDRFESLQLSPGATLTLFSRMHDEPSAARPFRRTPACPRCRATLALSWDRQRATRFQYWRCPADDGRFITFLEFLKEKDFIRPLSPEQLAELRSQVRTINCSNCGAPVDLSRETACRHCGSPLSMLDLQQMQRMADHLADAARPRRVDPSLPLLLERERLETERRLSTGGQPSWSLVGAGLRWLASLSRR
jgi:hypothetical protein